MTDRPVDELESLLGEWARGQRLDEAEIGEIRHRIVDAPALDSAWWNSLTVHVCAAVRMAGTPVPPPSTNGAPPRIAWSPA
jgi:hypothetical protein